MGGLRRFDCYCFGGCGVRLQSDGDANPAAGYVYGGGGRYAGASYIHAEAERDPHTSAPYGYADGGVVADAVAQPDR